MVVSIQPQQPNTVVRAAAEAALLRPGQVLEAVVIGRTPEGLTALKIGDVVIAAQLPQTLLPGTTLQLQVKVAGPAPQLALVGTPQVPAVAVPAPVLPLPQVAVLPTVVVSTGPASAPVGGGAPQPIVAGAPIPVPVMPVTPEAPMVVATPSLAVPNRPATAPLGAPPAQIVESQQVVVAPGARVESAAVSPSSAAPAALGAQRALAGSAQSTAVSAPPAAPVALSTAPAVLQPAAGSPVPVPAAMPSGSAPAPQATASVPTPQVVAPGPPAAQAAPLPVGPAIAPTTVPAAIQPPSLPVTAAPASAAAQQAVPAAPVASEPVAPSPLLVAQAATRPAPSAMDLPRPVPMPVASQPQAAVVPATPAAALAQMIPEALARQNSMAPLLASLAAVVLKPGLPEPVVRAALQVLAQRVQVAAGGPTAEQLELAVAKSGLYLEAALAKGAAPAGDLKGGLAALKGALATWLGGNPAPVAAGQQTPPPLRGLPPRAEAIDMPPLPGAAHDLGRALHGQADAALSRVKLMQLASLPDADPARATAQELRLELPLLIGHELVMAQFQVFRDAARRKTDGKRGWTMRFAMNFSATGEVGAEIGLLGRSVNVALWAADPDTAAGLEAALPELAPALAALGLEPGAVRLRSLPPEVPRPASGQYVDSRR